MIRKFEKVLTCAGSAGAATAEGRVELQGYPRVKKIVLDYTGATATADTTITDADEAVADNVLVQANSETDKVYYPVVAATKTSDGSASTLTETSPIAEALKIAVKEANSGDKVVVRVFAEG